MSDATKRSCAWSTSTDRGDVAGVVELWDDDLLTDFSKRVFNPDTYQGHDGIRRFYAGVREIWQSYPGVREIGQRYRWEVEAARVGDDSVIALLHCHAEGWQGGPPSTGASPGCGGPATASRSPCGSIETEPRL
jgi:hypothetical protein